MEKVAEDLNLSFLLENEREMILKVLQKDEKLRKREEKRIRKLKNELLEIKRKGSRRPQELGERQCARCLKTLGLIFDRGDLCEDCKLRVCNECRTTSPKGGQWKCNVCTKISELKVVTGEWFLEERCKRFEQGLYSSDMVKHTILNSPIVTGTKSPERTSAQDKQGFPEANTPDTPRSSRSAIQSGNGARRKGLKVDKRGGRLHLKPENGTDSMSVPSVRNADIRSVRSVHSAPASNSHRGSVAAVESTGMPTVPNNLRSQTPDRLSTSSNNRRVRPDGAESVASFHSSDSAPEKKDASLSDAPTISVSRASVSSDHSRSEMDLSAPSSEHSDDAFSVRSRSVPGLNEAEVSDEDGEEDIDALMLAHRRVVRRRLSNAVST
ncbi:hypothetical protein LDENG_00205530, partial [Lucifuga dentata]